MRAAAPAKAFLLTLVEALNVDLASDYWRAQARDRIAERENQAGPATLSRERVLADALSALPEGRRQ